MKRIAIAATASLLVLAGCSVTSTATHRGTGKPPASTEAVPSRPTVPLPVSAFGAVGQAIGVAGATFAITAVDFSTCQSAADPGDTIAMVSADISDQSTDYLSDGNFNWVLFDQKGNRYYPLDESTCPVVGDGSEGLAPGTTAKPVIYFDIPGQAAGLQLEWFTGDNAGDTATVDLGS